MLTTQSAATLRSADPEVEPGAVPFVWLVWGGLLLVLLFLVASFQSNIPLGDEWDHATLISGDQPLSVDWLWAQEVNHRFPLAKLVWLLLLEVSGYNFKILMFLNVLALGGLCGLLMWTARTIRGRSSYSDAFFPLMVLSPAQWENIFNGFQVQFVLVTVLSCLLLMTMVFGGGAHVFTRWRTTALTVLSLILLAVSTSGGVLLAAGLAVWFGGLAVVRWRLATDATERTRALVVLAGVVFCFGVIALYFRGYVSPSHIPPVKNVYDALRATVEFLGVSFSRGFGALFFGFTVFFLMMAGVDASLRAWIKDAPDRVTSLAIAFFLGVTGVLALAIGQGRGGFGPGAGLAPRYVTLMMPALACLYFAFLKSASPGFSRFFQILLFALACAALPMGLNEAFGAGQGLNQQFAALEGDLKFGMPASALVERHGSYLNINWTPDQADSAAEKIRMLHRAGVGVFGLLKEGSLSSSPVAPAAAPDASAVTGTAVGTLDRINQIDGPPVSTPERPFLLEPGKPVTLLGWMADRNDGAAFDDIYVVFNGRRVRAGRLSRPDVAAFHKNPALLLSGFTAQLAAEDLGKGVVRIDILGSYKNGGESYRFHNPVFVDAR